MLIRVGAANRCFLEDESPSTICPLDDMSLSYVSRTQAHRQWDNNSSAELRTYLLYLCCLNWYRKPL